ncbi:hypothetical protein Clacol_002028 [Clathrus columnatus]|uniref:FAD-binding domain-containing protein n=1 Tax=Clathrus columnatus TaxID=1419009 RepID=A0AAV5A3N5_9AGAM|nr:hypothetical protein Clacol_002028 [Clathrus columnatus]
MSFYERPEHEPCVFYNSWKTDSSNNAVLLLLFTATSTIGGEMAVDKKDALTAIISGGSLSGLMVAIVLKRLGFRVTVFERSTTVQSQGAGIVLGKWSTAFFQEFDKTKTEIALYYTLRANYDGFIKEGYINDISAAAVKDDRAEYFMGKTVVSHSYDSHLKAVNVTVRNGDGSEDHFVADLFVCAEGGSSSSREIYFPGLPRTYAGYLAFRGLVPEKDLEPDTAKTLIHSLSRSFSTNLAVPGPNGATTVGNRHMNFVWYNTIPEGAVLDKVLTDINGKRRPFSVSAGYMPQSVVEEEIHPRAFAKLSPQCLEVVMKTKHPFVQVVTDVIASSAVFHDGHVILVGDALSGARPHTTASTNQAADHALRLFLTLKTNTCDLSGLKAEWEPGSLQYSKYLWEIGAAIGNLSQFGDHPMNVDRQMPHRALEEWMKVGEPK